MKLYIKRCAIYLDTYTHDYTGDFVFSSHHPFDRFWDFSANYYLSKHEILLQVRTVICPNFMELNMSANEISLLSLLYIHWPNTARATYSFEEEEEKADSYTSRSESLFTKYEYECRMFNIFHGCTRKRLRIWYVCIAMTDVLCECVGAVVFGRSYSTSVVSSYLNEIHTYYWRYANTLRQHQQSITLYRCHPSVQRVMSGSGCVYCEFFNFVLIRY